MKGGTGTAGQKKDIPVSPEIMDDTLKYAIENGIIDLSHVQEIVEMQKRNEILLTHQQKIWQGEDGYWRTYLIVDLKRKLIKKKEKKDLEDVLVEHYRKELENPTIKEVFCEWNDRRLDLKKISASTYERNSQVFKRHYVDFGEERIKAIAPEDVEDFLEEQISLHNLTAKAFSNLKTITRGLLKRAKKRKLIDWSPEIMLDDMDVSDHDFKKTIKEDNQEVFDENDLPKIVECMESDMDLKNAGIMLMFLTGIRVGELVTLRHSDFEGNTFKVRRTETRVKKSDGKGYDYLVKEYPKTKAGIRIAIIPEDYTWLAVRLKCSNPFQEYVFVDGNNNRMTTNVFRRRMERLCRKAQIVRKSPHKARKTYASILLDNNIDNKMITDLMGHTDIQCTEIHYHRSRKSIEKKAEILNSIPEFVAK